MEDIIYFHINDWFSGRDYPDEEPFASDDDALEKNWMDCHSMEKYLLNVAWCKEQKICVQFCALDQSFDFGISATRDWVEKMCPCILNSKFVADKVTNENAEERGYTPYAEENFGVKYIDGSYRKRFKRVNLEENKQNEVRLK